MAIMEVVTSGSGVTEAARLQNTATAANNSGAALAFAANRTTSGLTNVASVQGLITDISQSAYEGALTFSTADNAAPAERMRVDSAGNLGIGLTSPSEKLEVGGNIAAAVDVGDLAAESYAQPTFTPSHTKWTAEDDFSFVGDVPTYAASAGSGSLYQEPADLAIPMVGSLYRFQVTLQNVTAGDIVCQLWGDTLLDTITLANGTITKELRFSGGYPPYLYCEGTTGGFEVVSISLKERSSGYLLAENTLSAEGSGLFAVSVGIGTTNPEGKLQVAGSLGSFRVDATGADVTLTRDGGNYIYANDPAGSLNLGAANVPNVIAISDTGAAGQTLNIRSGNVGVGVTSPSTKLQVMGGNFSVYNSSSSAGIYMNTAASAPQQIFADYLGGSEQPLQLGTYSSQTAVHIATSGNVGMGTTSPASRLDIASGALTMQEMTAPSSPASNCCVIYAEDNGSGKTRLMVKFATGSAQQIQIEP